MGVQNKVVGPDFLGHLTGCGGAQKKRAEDGFLGLDRGRQAGIETVVTGWIRRRGRHTIIVSRKQGIFQSRPTRVEKGISGNN
jgi:hypothetical protein